MKWSDFPRWGRWMANWAAEYHAGLRDRPVRAPLTPGATLRQLPATAPETPEPVEDIVADFERIVVPGLTHWQHPRFFAYFPSNASPASVLADCLTAATATQNMLWQTSPAATEMETRMMEWLRAATGLPDSFQGVIQDSASSATLAAVLMMRERALEFSGNTDGLAGHNPVRIYCSGEVHTSVDRAIWVAGIGSANLIRIPTEGPTRAMDPKALTRAIERDRAVGYIPAGVIASTGGTSTGGSDDIAAICAVAREQGLMVHVDAAWAGSAMICPEFRNLWAGVEQADSVVFNPHKWLGVQFDCSAHYVKDPTVLTRTLAYQPEFLKTHGADGVINYSEWSIPLGRRFRALKLWFLLRAYGLEHLRQMIRNHVAWTGEVCEALRATPGFTITTEPVLALFTFRLDGPDPDALNQRLVQAINDDGRIYLTQTKLPDGIAIRFTAGAFETTREDVLGAADVIREIASGLAA